MKNNLYNQMHANDQVRNTNAFDPMDLLANSLNADWRETLAGVNMRTDVVDLNDHYEVQAELPGFKKDDLHISYVHDRLTIHAKNEVMNVDQREGGHVLTHERSSSDVSRNFVLPDVDPEKITADYHNGILMVNLPKQVADHEIEIKIK